MSSAINPANLTSPFEDAFGDENQPYYRGDDPYQTKNARFDSLDELFLVAGIGDDFMDAFGARLTVYSDPNGRIDINDSDPAALALKAAAIADDPGLPRLADLNFPGDLAREIALRTFGGITALTTAQFVEVVEFLGVPVNPLYRQTSARDTSNPFTDRSYVFRIRATGTAGSVERRVDAVVTFEPNQIRQEASGLGRLLHWREE